MPVINGRAYPQHRKLKACTLNIEKCATMKGPTTAVEAQQGATVQRLPWYK